MSIFQPSALFHFAQGRLEGADTTSSVRRLKELKGVFADEQAWASMDPERTVYEVDMHSVCGEAEGGLLFGISRLYPGKVGSEYFMTKGHYHAKIDRGEYYWGMEGTGLLVLMDEGRRGWAENVFPGSLHYIPGRVAHRLVNTGPRCLVVGACWPADAGHDYASIQRDGFSVRAVEMDGKPALVDA